MAYKPYGGLNTFRMRNLSKSEYKLMKELIKVYGLDDPNELFSVVLRMVAKIHTMQEPFHGKQWIIQEIQEWRDISNKSDQREYDLS